MGRIPPEQGMNDRVTSWGYVDDELSSLYVGLHAYLVLLSFEAYSRSLESAHGGNTLVQKPGGLTG